MPWRGRGAAADPRPFRRPRRGGRSRPAAFCLLAAAALLGGAACAKEQPPPGARPDQVPPRVRDVRPADGTVEAGFDDDFRVRFDEPIQENRGLVRNMEASPAFRYRISFGFSSFEVKPEGGWRPAVYRLVFPPPFTDVLGNRSRDTLRVVFSTGPPLTETRVAGRIRDRATGEPVRGGRALFLAGEGDTVPYTAVAGTEGHFRLPSVPPDDYTAFGFEDLNANLSLDRPLEPHDSTRFSLEGDADSVYLDLLLVEPDTTSPALLSVRALDSAAVALTFDDPIRPDGGVAGAAVTVRAVDAGDTVPVTRLLLARDTAGARSGTDARPRGDVLPEVPSPVPDVRAILREAFAVGTAAARGRTGTPEDTARVPDDTAARPDSAAAVGTAGDSLALPDTVAVARLARPLEAGTRYRVVARGFENLRRLAGGGDTTFVYVPADTAGARPDSVATPPDTAEGVPSAPPDPGPVPREPRAARPEAP